MTFEVDKTEFESGKHPKLHCYLVMNDVIHFQCPECHDIVLLNTHDYGAYIGAGETLVLTDRGYKL